MFAQPRSPQNMENVHFTLLFCSHWETNQVLFCTCSFIVCSLTSLFGGVIHDVAVVVFLNSVLTCPASIDHKVDRIGIPAMKSSAASGGLGMPPTLSVKGRHYHWNKENTIHSSPHRGPRYPSENNKTTRAEEKVDAPSEKHESVWQA